MNNRPQITEDKLKTLIECLVAKFRVDFGDSKSKLCEKQFYLTDRMGCCKTAGLNFEHRAKTHDDQLINVNSSTYVSAVQELANRGWVEHTGNKLTFCLTEKGYEQGLNSNESTASCWVWLKEWANEHQAILTLCALIVAVVVGWITYAKP